MEKETQEDIVRNKVKEKKEREGFAIASIVLGILSIIIIPLLILCEFVGINFSVYIVLLPMVCVPLTIIFVAIASGKNKKLIFVARLIGVIVIILYLFCTYFTGLMELFFLILLPVIGCLIIFLLEKNKKQSKIEEKEKKEREGFAIAAIVLEIISLIIIPLLIIIKACLDNYFEIGNFLTEIVIFGILCMILAIIFSFVASGKNRKLIVTARLIGVMSIVIYLDGFYAYNDYTFWRMGNMLDEVLFPVLDMMDFFGKIIISCSIISYIILKIKSIKEKNSNENTIEKIKLSKKIIFITLAILIIIASLMELIDIVVDVLIGTEMDTINIKGITVMICLIVTIILLLISIIPIIKEKKRAIFVISIIMGIIFINCVDDLQKLRKEDEYKYGRLDGYYLQVHNSSFEQYAGEEVRGSTVRALLQAVFSNNKENVNLENRQVNIYGAVTLNKEDTDLSQSGYSEIDTGKTYKVEMIYDKYGKIESIYIEENQ